MRPFRLAAVVGFASLAGSPASAQISRASLIEVVQSHKASVLRYIDAAPDSMLGFRPTPGVRTFAEQVKHVATTNYEFFSAALGEKSAVDTSNENGPASITSKADIVKFLKDSFALGHRAAKSLTEQNFEERVAIGQGKSTRLFLNTFAVAHAFDHYGQMVEYLRMNGIVPPASRPQQ